MSENGVCAVCCAECSLQNKQHRVKNLNGEGGSLFTLQV